ncbi:MAG: hypothetical protein ACI9K2_004143 [Myxococcota bacterium]
MRLRLAALAAAAAATLACSGVLDETPPAVDEALDAIEATRLESNTDPLPPISIDGAAAPTMDAGNGVQVLQISPTGPALRALQAAVVFDRPMVALSDLDTMSGQVPLSCTPELPARARWAGTTTAVLIPETPDKAFPLASAFECSVPAGAKALDGVTLENTITWSFETPRPTVARTAPRDNSDIHEPGEPIRVWFSQPVDAAAIAPHVSLRGGGGVVPVTVTAAPDDDRSILVAADFASDTGYQLTISADAAGTAGPLPMGKAFEASFRTIPPLRITSMEPSGVVDPSARIGIQFSTRVPSANVAERLMISPEVEGWSPPDGDWATDGYYYWVGLKPRTQYTVTLKTGLKDQHGQRTKLPVKWSFETGDYPPWVDGSSGFRVFAANNPKTLPFRHLNVNRLEAKVVSVPMSDLRNLDWDDVVDKAVAGVQPQLVDTADEPNSIEIDHLDLAPHLNAAGNGLVAIEWSSPEIVREWDNSRVRYRTLLSVTDLAATMKVSPGAIEAWVTRLSDGTPVSGAEVTFHWGDRVLGTAKTDASGIASKRSVDLTDWSEWDRDDLLWVTMQKGEETGLARHQWRDGLQTWQFGIYSSFDADGQDEVGHAFTDRGIYRLGDPVYARSTFRTQDASGLTLPPAGAKVMWEATGPEGESIASGKGSLDDRGGVSVTFDLPDDGRLGTYQLKVNASTGGWSATTWSDVPVRAYRPPAFRVDVSGPDEAVAGKDVTAHMEARYLFGAELASGTVSWSAWTTPTRFSPDEWEGWSFGPERNWWSYEQEYESRGVLSSDNGTLAELSDYTVSLPLNTWDRPQTLTIEAEVMSPDRQTIAGSASVVAHPADYYLGVRPTARLPKAGKEATVEVVAVERDGTLRDYPVTADVVISRRTWDRVREKGMDGRWQWVSTPVDEQVSAVNVAIRGAVTPATWTPDEPGLYYITATAQDTAGNDVQTVESVYVTGSGYTGWGMSDDAALELVPDKAEYAPGDTAQILVKTPKEGMRALVTVEREGVLTREVVELAGTAETIEVPITEAYLPNVFVSVVAISGAAPQDSPDAGRPEVRFGMASLSVDAEGEHVAVAIDTDQEVYRPRDTVSVTIDVTRGDTPVPNAGVTLYAVDEAILMLTAYKTPDAHSTFYSDHSLSVITADSRSRVLDRADYLTKGANRGGGGGLDDESGPQIRKKFLTTATWQPDLRTGPDGTVKATFDLPDNLTAFRIMAVVDEGATAFGSGDKEIRVDRPLMARPALPRFLRTGDVAYAGVVVHNNTDSARSVTVDATVTGAARLEGSPHVVQVPANDAMEVPFRIKGLDPGEAVFTFVVEGGGDDDAVEWRIPVTRELALDVVATAGTTTDSVTERIAKPDDALPGEGGLALDLSSTVLVGAGSGLDYLWEYPHGCVEQTTSRAMASLVALQIREAAGVSVSEEQLRRNVEKGLADLRDFERSTGGYAYWPGGRTDSVMGTAYAVELMGRAEAIGFAVDQARKKKATAFLREVLNGRRLPSQWDPLVKLSAQAYVAVALARAGDGDAGHNSTLYRHRSDLSVLGLASVLEAIARTTGSDSRTADLERLVQSRMYIDAATASVKENDTGKWSRLWGSDDWATAAVLEAVLQLGDDHPLAPRIARGLAQSRRSGRWANTRATAGVLASLAAYADRYESGGGEVSATVTLAGKQLAQEALAVPMATRTEVTMDDLVNGPLEISAAGGRLYYEARVTYAPRTVEARDEGFTVLRELEILEGGGDDGAVTAGALVRVTLRVVTPIQRYTVALVDPLPAGFEGVDSSLATSSERPRGGDEDGSGSDELPAFGGSWVFDHSEMRDGEVRLYANFMPPGVHTWRYVARATTPGTFDHPAATVEAMYQPEVFGRTAAGRMTIGREAVAAK